MYSDMYKGVNRKTGIQGVSKESGGRYVTGLRSERLVL
jgi:hypothetical protein